MTASAMGFDNFSGFRASWHGFFFGVSKKISEIVNKINNIVTTWKQKSLLLFITDFEHISSRYTRTTELALTPLFTLNKYCKNGKVLFL